MDFFIWPSEFDAGADESQDFFSGCSIIYTGWKKKPAHSRVYMDWIWLVNITPADALIENACTRGINR